MEAQTTCLGPFLSSLASPSLMLPIDPVVHISNPRYTIKKLSSRKKKGELTMEGPNTCLVPFLSSLAPYSPMQPVYHVDCILYPRYTIKKLDSNKK